jgi:phage repressor protein C with HTH and peptisase S24 domain
MLNAENQVYNILEIRNLYGLSQTEFARKAQMSRELVNKVENGKAELKNPSVKKIRRFLENNPPQKYSQDVNILGMPAAPGRSRLPEPYLQQRLEQKNEAPEPLMVPLVGIKAQAGYVKGFEEVDYLETLDKYTLPPGVNPAGAVWRYFEIDGDSMEPTLSGGDLILATMVNVEDWNDLRDFSVYIIHTADQLLVKRLYKKSSTQWVLISDNEELYPQVLLDVASVRQLWLFRRHIRSSVPQPKEIKITA